MADLEAREVRLTSIAQTAGDLEGEVGSEILEVGINVAALSRQRDRKHMGLTGGGPDDVDLVAVPLSAHLRPSSVRIAPHPGHRWREANDVRADAGDQAPDRRRQWSGGEDPSSEGNAHVGAVEALGLAPPPAHGKA